LIANLDSVAADFYNDAGDRLPLDVKGQTLLFFLAAIEKLSIILCELRLRGSDRVVKISTE
jgi:hypothetical protein